jgi:drug/metabolite transporter (DMT)-like permease
MGRDGQARTVAASFAVALAGAAWGAYWIPFRHIQTLGLTGNWTTAALFVVSLPPAAILLIWAWRELRANCWTILWLALANGAVFALYSNAYAYTTVFNNLFLFYLSPIWSVLIVRFWFGEKTGWARMGCVALGLAGLVTMLSAEGGWPAPRNLGDWMSLTSGVLWAVVAISIRRNQQIGVAANGVAFFFGGVGPAILFALLVDGPDLPSRAALEAAWPVLLAVAWAAWIPAQCLLFWGVRQISPVRTGMLLMTEIVTGVATAAWLSGDPISWPQALGGAMILAAGLGDMLTTRERQPPSPLPVVP